MWLSENTIVSLKNCTKYALIAVISITVYRYIGEGENDERRVIKIESTTRDVKQKTGSSSSNNLDSGSSVWCRGENTTNRLCRFRNLCLHPATGDFIFLHGPNTIISGISLSNEKEAIVDLSSIEGHNGLQLTVVDVPAERVANLAQNIHVINETSLIMKRFKPNNIMHVFHDDLMPLDSTLCEIGSCDGLSDVQLVFVDQRTSGPFWELYKLFSSLPLILWLDMQKDDLYCFQNAYVGLNRRTVWYQYGFADHQGPLPNNTVTSVEIDRFKSKLMSTLQSQLIPSECPKPNIGILLSRKNTRLILNEDEVMGIMKQELSMPIVKFSLDSHSLLDIIAHIRCAKILVGVHGALLVLSMFLQRGTSLIELFPYAIPPEKYTPYKTLVSLPGMGIAYKSWRNKIEQNSVTHADWPKEYGGIAHLPLNEQAGIYAQKEVLPHKCCSNPNWLFRIYQDTYVDSLSFLKVFQEASRSSETFMELEDLEETLMFPGRVAYLSCVSSVEKNNVKLQWRQPWNVATFRTRDKPMYEVWAQFPNENGYKIYVTNQTEKMIDKVINLNVWVRCKYKKKFGPFRWTPCNPINETEAKTTK